MTKTESEFSTASSEAIFGSSARGDTDQMSDRDILIVDEDVSVLRARSKVLKAAGWSVASYTFAKLDALAERGALFIQHLKLESTITIDRNERLRTRLERFEPRSDYASEIGDNDQLASLAGIMPDSPSAPLLSADILYVTVRNFGVLKLAERGIHVYSYDHVLRELERSGFISPGSSRHLSALRFLKCLYRSGEDAAASRAKILIADALRSLPSDHFPSRLKLVDPLSFLKAPCPPDSGPAYLQLRDLERRYLALKSIGLTPEQSLQFDRLSEWIKNPRAYSFVSGLLAPELRLDMYRIAEHLDQGSQSAMGRAQFASRHSS